MIIRRSTYFYALILGCVLSFQSCIQNGEPAFLVDVQRDFDVTSNLTPVVTHFFELKNVPTNLEQNLSVFGLPEENIEGISPADAVLTTASGFMDWSLVNNVEIYAVSRLDPNVRVQMFFIRGRNANNDNELRLFNTLGDLTNIMQEGSIDLEVRITTIASVPGNFRARLLFNYAVFDEL